MHLITWRTLHVNLLKGQFRLKSESLENFFDTLQILVIPDSVNRLNASIESTKSRMKHLGQETRDHLTELNSSENVDDNLQAKLEPRQEDDHFEDRSMEDSAALANKLKCRDCGKYFSTLRSLKTHGLIHTGVKPFECHLCGKKFRLKHHLVNHLKTHTEPNNQETPLPSEAYECERCGESFMLKNTLDDHLKTHDVNQTWVSIKRQFMIIF